MVPWELHGCSSCCSLATPPYNLVPKLLMTKNLIHFHLNVVTCMPVTVNEYAPGLLEQPLHLEEASVEPYQITRHPTFPDVGKGAKLVLVAKYDVILPTGEEGRVDVDQVYAFAGQLTHHMQIVSPKEAVGFEFGMSERNPIDHLEGQSDAGKQLAETPAPIPPQRLLLHRHRAESHRRVPERLLFGQRVRRLVLILDLWRRDENSLARAYWLVHDFLQLCFHGGPFALTARLLAEARIEFHIVQYRLVKLSLPSLRRNGLAQPVTCRPMRGASSRSARAPRPFP